MNGCKKGPYPSGKVMKLNKTTRERGKKKKEMPAHAELLKHSPNAIDLLSKRGVHASKQGSVAKRTLREEGQSGRTVCSGIL